MADEQSLMTEVTVAVATEIAKEAYKDLAHPALSATGNVIGIVPQIIERVLLPVQQWVAEGQYKLAETKKLLALKLKNVAPEQIVSPETYIAVPALQAISYAMDNEEIRDMFANLLASSMTIDKKKNVHPAFIEIIKQLTPDEAKILKYIYQNNLFYVIDVEQTVSNKNLVGVINWVENYSLLAEKISSLDHIQKIPEYYANLRRLNLLDTHFSPQITGIDPHKEIIDHFLATHSVTIISESNVKKKQISLNVFGKAFCEICISKQKENQEASK